MGWTNGLGEEFVRLADSTGSAITSSNPAQMTLAQLISGEVQANNYLRVIPVDGSGFVNLAAVNASGQMGVSFGPIETQFSLPTLNTKFVTTGTIAPVGRIKVIWIVVTTALTWVTSATPTIQLYASRTSFAAAGGATTPLGLGQTYIGPAINALAGAATTWTLNNVLRLSANTISSSVGATNGVALAATNNPNSVTTPVSLMLNDPDTFIGLEFAFPSALTGGAMSVYLEQGN